MAASPSALLCTLATAAILLSSALPARAVIVAGPFTNPANGHTYYLLDQKSWQLSEAEATTLGGHLVTIDDAAENAWVTSTFFPHAQGQGNLWIGLNDMANEGTFVWSSGSPSPYRNWAPTQPDNNSDEDYVHIFGPGRAESPQWNDFFDSGIAATLTVPHGVVEVSAAQTPGLVPVGLLVLGAGLAALGLGRLRQRARTG